MKSSIQRNTLAVALIVKNEEKHLRACLETVADWVDEIVILDSGSTDGTESIAREFTDKFYVNNDWPGFGKQRQLAQSYIESDYVLWLDADERVTEKLKQSIIGVLKENNAQTVYQLNRLSSAFGQFIKHSGWSPDWIVRLYKVSEASYNDDLVHEKVIVPPRYKKRKLSGYLYHYTYDDLFQYNNKSTTYIKAWADAREGRKASSPLKALVHALTTFLKMYVIKLGFLDGKHGFILAWLAMNYTFLKYADLYLRNQIKNEQK